MDRTDEAWSPDLIAFKWAETLSTGEQSVLLTSSLKRLQTMIDSRASVAAPPPDSANEAANKIADYFNAPPSVIPAIEQIIKPCLASPVAATVDAETPPFSLDDVVQQLNRVLGLLESIEDHSGKMSVQEPLPKARVILRGLIGHCTAASSAARHYSCSCGGALTAEEYIEHYFEKGHDRCEPSAAFKAAAAEIDEMMSNRLSASAYLQDAPAIQEIAVVISKHLGWLPIETAPKDEPLWLFGQSLIDEDYNRKGVVEGYWLDDLGWMGAVWNNEQDYWESQQINPTHWMPIPSAPADTPTSTKDSK